jgi:hypothetical protein
MKKAIPAIALLTIAGYFAIYGVRTTRLETVRRQIEQNVNVGCRPEDVIRFLDSQHLEHSGLMRLSEYETLHRTYGDAQLILARKRRTWEALFQSESIVIIFVFDESSRLRKFDLRNQYTGL